MIGGGPLLCKETHNQSLRSILLTDKAESRYPMNQLFYEGNKCVPFKREKFSNLNVKEKQDTD